AARLDGDSDGPARRKGSDKVKDRTALLPILVEVMDRADLGLQAAYMSVGLSDCRCSQLEGAFQHDFPPGGIGGGAAEVGHTLLGRPAARVRDMLLPEAVKSVVVRLKWRCGGRVVGVRGGDLPVVEPTVHIDRHHLEVRPNGQGGERPELMGAHEHGPPVQLVSFAGARGEGGKAILRSGANITSTHPKLAAHS